MDCAYFFRASRSARSFLGSIALRSFVTSAAGSSRNLLKARSSPCAVELVEAHPVFSCLGRTLGNTRGLAALALAAVPAGVPAAWAQTGSPAQMSGLDLKPLLDHLLALVLDPLALVLVAGAY